MRLELELRRANEGYLALLADSTRHEVQPRLALVKELRARLIGLDVAARIRAGKRPYLLAAFHLGEAGAGEHHGARNAAVELARRVLWLMWHTVRFQSPGVGLRLGVLPEGARKMAELSLDELNVMAEQEGSFLYPRWPEQLGFWKRLLEAAEIHDINALQSIDLHAVQLLAGEMMGLRPSWVLAGATPHRPSDDAGKLAELQPRSTLNPDRTSEAARFGT